MMLPTGVTQGKPNPLHFKFADRLRRSRRATGQHAAGLSRAAGLNKNAVGMLEAERAEKDRGLPTLSTVEKLARTLGLSPGWLAYGLGDAAALPAGRELLCLGLAARARGVRAALGLSLRDTAERAGVTDGAVRSVESGRHPAINTLEKLANALGVSPAWLAFNEGPRELPRRGSQKLRPVDGPPA